MNPKSREELLSAYSLYSGVSAYAHKCKEAERDLGRRYKFAYYSNEEAVLARAAREIRDMIIKLDQEQFK